MLLFVLVFFTLQSEIYLNLKIGNMQNDILQELPLFSMKESFNPTTIIPVAVLKLMHEFLNTCKQISYTGGMLVIKIVYILNVKVEGNL